MAVAGGDFEVAVVHAVGEGGQGPRGGMVDSPRPAVGGVEGGTIGIVEREVGRGEVLTGESGGETTAGLIEIQGVGGGIKIGQHKGGAAEGVAGVVGGKGDGDLQIGAGGDEAAGDGPVAVGDGEGGGDV